MTFAEPGPTIVKVPQSLVIVVVPRVIPLRDERSSVKAEATDVIAAAQIDVNSILFMLFCMGLIFNSTLYYTINNKDQLKVCKSSLF